MNKRRSHVNLFKAKTPEGFKIKMLAELLQNNIKTACFEISESGIKLRMINSHRIILIDLELSADNFTIYKFRSENKITIGINLNHFHKMLKSIKKKDNIILFIRNDNPTELGIKVIPKENNRKTISYIKIQNVQNISIELPKEYNKPIIVPSIDYQKTCKDMNSIGGIINVVSNGYYVKFLCNTGNVLKREVIFGEIGDDDDSDYEDDDQEEYSQKFDTEQFCRIVKMAGLGSVMHVFPKGGNPILFRSNIGTLGNISIYIKSREQIELEENNEGEYSD